MSRTGLLRTEPFPQEQKFVLRALQLQQHQYTLQELELPRLLAPDVLPLEERILKRRSIAKTQIAPATLSYYLLNKEWVIYAPAAILRCGSRLSGSLSGIEP